jgi:hypothetical protein
MVKENGFSAEIGGSSNSALSLGYKTLSFPAKEHPEFENPAFIQELVTATVDVFQPTTACVTSYDFFKALAFDNFIGRTIGWMNYFGDAQVKSFLPDDVLTMPCGAKVLLSTLQPTQSTL